MEYFSLILREEQQAACHCRGIRLWENDKHGGESSPPNHPSPASKNTHTHTHTHTRSLFITLNQGQERARGKASMFRGPSVPGFVQMHCHALQAREVCGVCVCVCVCACVCV